MDNTAQNLVLSKIRSYALRQLRSAETVETIVMLGLVIYMIWIFYAFPANFYSIIVFIAFVCVLLFGLYETLPAVVMFFRPFRSRAFRMAGSDEDKAEICREIEESVRKKDYVEYPDMTSTDRYAVLEGRRNIEIIRWEDITALKKKEFPFRQKYKGTFLLYFVDRKGKEHELDIHNGKLYNPVRQVSLILHYIEEHHPHVSMELTEIDRGRIRDMLVEMEKIRNPKKDVDWLSKGAARD